jgi:hypothetical protein
MSHDVWPKSAQLDSMLGRLKLMATLSMLLPCEPARLASYLRCQGHVYRLVYHDSRFVGIIPSTSLVEGFVCQQPLLGGSVSFRGPNAHERQPHIVEVLHSSPVAVLPGEGAASHYEVESQGWVQGKWPTKHLP